MIEGDMSYDKDFISSINDIEDVQALPEDLGYIDQLKKNFPIEVNRIAWPRVMEYCYKKIKISDISVAKTEVLQFLDRIKVWADIDGSQKVIVISDGALEKSYQMSFSSFEAIFDKIFFLPQHTYVVPVNLSWCINYTFEDDLYFGLSLS